MRIVLKNYKLVFRENMWQAAHKFQLNSKVQKDRDLYKSECIGIKKWSLPTNPAVSDTSCTMALRTK